MIINSYSDVMITSFITKKGTGSILHLGSAILNYLNSELWRHDHDVTSDNVIVPIKLYPEVENDEYIILRNYGGHSMSCF